jgi:hypothetical protein
MFQSLVPHGGISVMNKVLSLLLVAGIAVAAIPYARGLGAPESPPGIAADHWIAMGVAAGFVITDTANDLRNGLRNEPNVVKGYFMVRPAKSWVKVESGPESGIYQTHLTR